MKLCDMWDLLHYNLERAEVNGEKIVNGEVNEKKNGHELIIVKGG